MEAQHYQQAEPGRSTPRETWRQTRAQSRRVRFWVKDTLRSLAHQDVFEDTQHEAGETSVEVESAEQENDNRESDDEKDDFDGNQAVCCNIDDAMAGLHTLPNNDEQVGDMTTWKDAPQVEHDYDWILDGDPEWAEDFDKSQKLHQSLCQLELEDPTLRLDFDVLGRQSNRFANFDDDYPPVATEPVVEKDDDGFGDFVSADVGEPEADCKEENGSTLSLERPDYGEGDSGESSTPPESATHEAPPSTPDAKTSEPIEKATETEPRSVYKLFPLADVSSPENRFTRRRQLMTHQYVDRQSTNKDGEWWRKSEQQMEEDLPPEFYSETFDSTLELLLDLPWEHVSCWQDEKRIDADDIFIVDEHVTKKLSELDAAQARVKTNLLCQIKQREDMLQEGNQLLHDMDHNLAMAHLYVHRGLDALNQAEGREQDFSGISAIGTLIWDADRRDQLREVRRVLNQCNSLFETEESLSLRIESFGVGPIMKDSSRARQEYRELIEVATQLKNDVDHNESLSRLDCLEPLRQRSNTALRRLHDRLNNVLMAFVARCCHSSNFFPSCEYETLLRATLDVRIHQVSGKAEAEHCLSWSQCILSALFYEADKCLPRALLDPAMGDENPAESVYEKELIHLSFELNNGSGDTAKLRTLMHNLVTIRFGFESEHNHLPLVYHKLCMLLSDLLHTHYLLLQWHQTPFDERNKDMAHLHRRQTSEIPEEKKSDESHTTGIDETDCPISNPSNSRATARFQQYAPESAEYLDSIGRELSDAKISIWKHCESVLVTCLDQYLHFAAKKNFFQSARESSSDGEIAWLTDLEGMQDVLRLTQQFLLIGHEFLDKDCASMVTSLGGEGKQNDLRDKLCEVFRKHLRVVHVEAMNSMGAMLFHESWKLEPAGEGGSDSDNLDQNQSNKKETTVRKCLMSLLDVCTPTATSKPRCWENQIHKSGAHDCQHLPAYVIKGNPFVPIPKSYSVDDASGPESTIRIVSDSDAPELVESSEDSSVEDEHMELYPMLCFFLEEDDEYGLPPLATDSALNGLTNWTRRILTIMKRLPIILEDVAVVFSNLYDLYFTTAFRLCAGNSRNEKIIIGSELPFAQDAFLGETGSAEFESTGRKRRSSGSSIFGRSRRSSKGTPRSPPEVSPTAEAEVCAPLPSETHKMALVSEFIERGQSSLNGIVNLEKIEQWMSDPIQTSCSDVDKGVMSAISTMLERRAGAAWSCLFVAALLETAWSHAQETFVRSSYLDTVLGESSTSEQLAASKALTPFTTYVKSVVNVVPSLAAAASRIACSRAIYTKSIIQEITQEQRWAELTVHVDTNDYVDELINRFTTTWIFLASSPQPLPVRVLSKTWDHLVSSAYLCVLDGFAGVCRHVPNLPAESIALMSMDVAAFESGIAEIGPETKGPCCLKGRNRVAQWITALYLPDADLMQWITDNYGDYHLHQSFALLASRIGLEGQSAEVKKMVTRIKTLYRVDAIEPPRTIQRYDTC